MEALLAPDPAGEQGAWRRLAPYGVGVLVAAMLAFVLYRFLTHDSKPRKTVSNVVTVKLVQPPPPPPPKPEEPVEEQIQPEPEPMELPQPMEQPQALAAPDAMPGPAGPPGVAGLPGGGAPGGMFGGGGGGVGGGGGGNPFGSYAALLQSRVEGAVRGQAQLKRKRYRAVFRVWLNDDGVPQRVELIDTLGSAELDKKFRETVLGIERLPQAPPAGMPQPIVLRVNSL